MKTTHSRTTSLLVLASALSALTVKGQAIPEPPITLYGTVVNVQGGANVLLNFGTLTWTFQGPPGVSNVTITTELTNINDQFTYVIEVPCESAASSGGFLISSNTLTLTSEGVSYNRSALVNMSAVATIKPPAFSPVTLPSSMRGRFERVDLEVNFAMADVDMDGLPDAWEEHFFGIGSIFEHGPDGDRDMDGVSNGDEFAAGTDPTDANSFLRFVHVAKDPLGVRVEWSSAPGKLYAVHRSGTVIGGFTAIATNIAATPPINVHRDITATNAGPYFYRIRLER